MAEMFTVVTPAEALQRLLAQVALPPLAAETVPLPDGLDRILAQDLYSAADVPAFPRATMDGYAVRAPDTFGASEGSPAYLTLAGEVGMGDEVAVQVGQDQAVRIATGGMLPAGSDAVVMIEHTQTVGATMVEVGRAVAPGDNVAQVGEDIRRGARVLARGHRLRPWDLGALAALGLLQVEVIRRPRVAIISSGNEVVPPDQQPRGSQIRDINTYSLAAAVREAGGIPLPLGIVPDHYDLLRASLTDAVERAEMVLISGGSSVGTMDFTFRAIEELGPPGVIVHGVSVRPGKPTVLAAARGKPIVGLPGQPVSALVIFELLARPVLWRLAGYQPPWPEAATIRARISRHLASAPGRQDHVRVALERRGGEVWAVPVLGKSGSISTLVKAIGEVVISLDREGLETGAVVEVRLL